MINSRFIYYRTYAQYLLAKPHFQYNCVYHCEENNVTWFHGKELGQFSASDIRDNDLDLTQHEINDMLTQGYILKDGEWVKSGTTMRYSESEWNVIQADADTLAALLEEYVGWDIEIYEDNGTSAAQKSSFTISSGVLTLSSDSVFDATTGTLTLGSSITYNSTTETLTIEV